MSGGYRHGLRKQTAGDVEPLIAALRVAREIIFDELEGIYWVACPFGPDGQPIRSDVDEGFLEDEARYKAALKQIDDTLKGYP